MAEFVLDNGTLRVGFTTAGGSFTSLVSQGREYLWQGDPAVWSGQAPVCFPICGGLREDVAQTRSGKQIKLGRHGFARKQEWELAEQGEDSIAFKLARVAHPELLEQFPFPFTLVARYALDGAKLQVSYEVTNEGDEDMPFFIGGHPGFACPLDDDEGYSDY